METIVVAALGLLSTLGGVWLTQRRSDRREREAWQRTTDLELRRWEREDAARTFEERRDATVDFYESLRTMAVDVYNHGLGLTMNEEDLADLDWHLPTFRKLQHLRVYGSPEVIDAATVAYNAAAEWGSATSFRRDDAKFYELEDRYDRAEAELLLAIRRDLGVPELAAGEADRGH